MLGFQPISFGPLAFPDSDIIDEMMHGGVECGGLATVQCSHDTSDGAALAVWLTGASYLGQLQSAQSASLGGYRSGVEASRFGFEESTAVSNVNTLSAARSNGPGLGSLIVMGDTVAFTAPNGTLGTGQTLTVGMPMVLEDGANPNCWVKVMRTTSDPLKGFGVLQFEDQFSNVFSGGDDGTVSGLSSYRAVIITNNSLNTVTSVNFWVNPVQGTPSSCTSFLSSSGAGYLMGNFADWGWSGFCHISSGEIVYYSSRTNELLKVPSIGRGLLGTTAQAGSLSDTLTPVGPVQIALETPGAGGNVQTISSETVVPTGLTWSTGITPGTGLSVSSLSPNQSQSVGLWINRQLPAGMTAYPEFPISIGIQFTTTSAVTGLSTTYTDSLNGLFRVSDSTLDRYELYVGEDGPPDLTQPPAATFTTSPHTYTLAPSHTWYLSTARRNTFNLVSEQTDWTVIALDSNGNPINTPPSAPTATITALGTGAFNVVATYFFQSDPVPADEFQIYITFDGSAPLNASPIVVSVGANVGGLFYLNYTTSTHSIPTTARCVVRTLRSSDGQHSSNVNEIDATSVVTAFGTVTVKGFYGTNAEETA